MAVEELASTTMVELWVLVVKAVEQEAGIQMEEILLEMDQEPMEGPTLEAVVLVHSQTQIRTPEVLVALVS
jgi:hypothetical protein